MRHEPKIYGYEPETKLQASSSLPWAKEKHRLPTKMKMMLTSFFDHKLVLHQDYVCSTIHQHFSLETRKCSYNTMCYKKP
jgi:hypothetical protein